LEQLDRQLPTTTTVTPSVTKNVVEVIKENNDEPKNNDDLMLMMIEAPIDDKEVRIRETKRGTEVMTMAVKFETVNNEVSLKKMGEVRRRIEKLVSLDPPAKSSDSEVNVVVSEEQIIQAFVVEIQPPPKPPDTVRSAMMAPRRVPPPKPPGLLNTSLGVVDTILGENVSAKIGTKVEIDELGILLNPMGQMHKSWPFILHCNNLSHLSSSGQHTSLLSHESPNGHPSLFPVMCCDYIRQCELGQLYQLISQAQINASLLMKKIKNWGRVETQELVPFYNSTWIHEKEGSISKIPSLILWGPDHNFLSTGKSFC
jgi:hypothetical protein